MSQGISSIETDLVTPECIAEELTTLGLLTGGLVGVHHLIKLTPFNVCSMGMCMLMSAHFHAKRKFPISLLQLNA